MCGFLQAINIEEAVTAPPCPCLYPALQWNKMTGKSRRKRTAVYTETNLPWLISCRPGARILPPFTQTHTQMPCPVVNFTPHHQHHFSGVSSSLSLFISVPEQNACLVISRAGSLNAYVTHTLIRRAREGCVHRGEVKRQAREERTEEETFGKGAR